MITVSLYVLGLLLCIAWLSRLAARAESDPNEVRYREWCARRDMQEHARQVRVDLRRESWPPIESDEDAERFLG